MFLSDFLGGLFQLSQCFSVLFSLLFPKGSFLDFFSPAIPWTFSNTDNAIYPVYVLIIYLSFICKKSKIFFWPLGTNSCLFRGHNHPYWECIIQDVKFIGIKVSTFFPYYSFHECGIRSDVPFLLFLILLICFFPSLNLVRV